MSITHCPTCKEALHLWPSFTGATCLFCINPHCSDNTEHPCLSSLPGHQDQSARLAASAEVGQVGGTITCAACGSTNTESCCHPAEFCQAICNDCNKPLNADGSVWVEKQEPTLEQFQRWLQDKAHAAHAHYWTGPEGETLSQEVSRCRPYTLQILECRKAAALLMQFKLEQQA